MFYAVRSPWHRIEPFLVDRLAVHNTTAERSLVDSLQRVPHLGERGRIKVGFGELFFPQFVGYAVIADIAGRIGDLFASLCPRPVDAGDQLLLHVE